VTDESTDPNEENNKIIDFLKERALRMSQKEKEQIRREEYEGDYNTYTVYFEDGNSLEVMGRAVLVMDEIYAIMEGPMDCNFLVHSLDVKFIAKNNAVRL
jgi:hypothetical protein